jgi:2-polyprenyl-3-methyl-5-hydroxy-6-metoxy-1,4-benzoquinol methylase
MLTVPFSLTLDESHAMSNIAADTWFTQVSFANAVSPRSQQASVLDTNHEMKKSLMLPWIRRVVPGKRVLDLFCANGAFSIECALAGAREVVGIEFDAERVRCAQFLAAVLERNGMVAPRFSIGDVYALGEYAGQPFDVVLCMGGLYHIADPPHVLSQIRNLMGEKLIIQTSGILPGPTNRATFVIREDQTSKGLTSLRGGKGVWKVSVSCFRSILRHAGLRVVQEKQPKILQRRRFPWYCALAEPL